jgi:type II secretory pathway component PulJ
MLKLQALLNRIHLRDESGLTVTEMAVTGLLGSIILATASMFLVNSMNTSIFTQGQSETINNVRNAVQRIEKEVRGADSISWAPAGPCSGHPAGACLVVGAQTPNANFITVRYTHVGSELQRAVFNEDASTWRTAQTLIERVANSPSQPVFTCDTQVTLLRVTLDLYVEATPSSDPNFHIQTSLRPRNFPSVASCP